MWVYLSIVSRVRCCHFPAGEQSSSTAVGNHCKCSSPRCTALGLCPSGSLCWYQSQNPARAFSALERGSSSKATNCSCQTVSLALNTNASDSMILWTRPIIAPIIPRVLTSWTSEGCLDFLKNPIFATITISHCGPGYVRQSEMIFRLWTDLALSGVDALRRWSLERRFLQVILPSYLHNSHLSPPWEAGIHQHLLRLK